MRPPQDRWIGIEGIGTDIPVRRLAYGVRLSVVFAAATVLGLLSTILAWQLTQSMGKTGVSWRWLAVLNGTYWYVWALFTPAIVWLSQHFRFERQGLARAVAVHLPSVLLFSLAHIAVMSGVQSWIASYTGRPVHWWTEVQRAALQNFDWEMMTYWAIAGVSHAVLYYRESRERAVRGAVLETRLVEAQMRTLQQQLQPHFLFNTLHAISALMHRDVEAADRTLIRLSDLLRMTLDNLGEQQVTLKTEIDFLTKYLEIEQTRFADRLQVEIDVHPDALDVLVPTFLVQPLVENAIKHGISKKKGPGRIHVRAGRDHEKLCIEVRDDGVGLSETALTAFQKGIGVSTTRARLQHQYGADYRFEFHRLSQGLAVVVGVPWRKAPHAHEPVDPAKPAERIRSTPSADYAAGTLPG